MRTILLTEDNLSCCSIYLLLDWPYWDSLTNQSWFDSECIAHQPKDSQLPMIYAYFIPMERFAEAIQAGLIALQV